MVNVPVGVEVRHSTV